LFHKLALLACLFPKNILEFLIYIFDISCFQYSNKKKETNSKMSAPQTIVAEVPAAIAEVPIQGGASPAVVAEVPSVVEGGKTPKKKHCKRGKTRRGTGVCHKKKSARKTRSRSRSRKMGGGEGEATIEGGLFEVIEGGARMKKRSKSRSRSPCKRGMTRSRKTGRCHRLKGGETSSDLYELIEGGEVFPGGEIQGGASSKRKPCKRGKTRAFTGRCHKVHGSRSRSSRR
jgi:hypothetical protein